MADPHIRAAFYLSPTLDALWRWTSDGEVLIWPNDTTIAFRAEVDAVLQRLGQGGLPPFGAVALLLAACREGWAGSIGRETIAGYARVFGNMNVDQSSHPVRAAQSAFHNLARDINALLEQLDAVNRLPRDLIDNVAAKALLAEVVFEGAKSLLSPHDSAMILHALDEGISPESLRPQLSHEESLAQFARQVDGLTEGLRRVDAETLQRRAKTGLDEPIKPAGEEVSPPDAVRRLLAELRDDEELSGLARLARDLMAAVSVPRSLRSREDLSVGGVSDLSNRGSLDRLLISELAHDDLTLAVRVAMNEALYLRRESPPREPPHRRAILIDAGIRMWGTPRVFATAVALALSATNDPHAPLAIFRAAKKRVEPVDLTTRGGLDSHLGVLESSPHPGAALEPFFTQLNTVDSPTDVILITHADVLGDPDFLGHLLSLDIPAMYVAAVDRDGGFSLRVSTKAGQKKIRDAKLSLEEILNGSPRKLKAAPLVDRNAHPDLPAILYAEPFPFLLPHIANPRLAAVSAKFGLVAAAHDGRLLHWRDGQHGARQLFARVPRGLIHAVVIDDATDSAIVVVTRKRDEIAHVVNADLNTGHCALVEVNLRLPEPTSAFIRGGVVYFNYSYKNRVDGYSVSHGAFVGTLNLPAGTRWNRDRFFRDAGGHLTIARNGPAELKLEQISASMVNPSAVTPFEREGKDDLCSIFKHGIIGVSHGRVIGKQITGGVLRGVSADGHRVVFGSFDGDWLVDLTADGEARRLTGSISEELLGPQFRWSSRATIGVRNAFKGIYADPVSRICLLSKEGKVFSLDFDSADALRVNHLGTMIKDPARLRPFSEPCHARETRIGLALAGWEDGSKAWLDLRGMLHLKSSDASVPEISITLSDEGCAVWLSNGRMAGPEFFLRSSISAGASRAYFESVLRQFVARLR